MEETETPHPDYQKGFNEGYLIAQHLPEVSEHISKATGESLRLSGFQDSRKQFIADQFKERLPSWLKNDRFTKDDLKQDKGKDKDIEPEL